MGNNFSPEKTQIAFLKELLKDTTKREAFLKEPKEYVKKQNISLDPEFIRLTVDSVLYDVEVTDSIKKRLGENGLKDLADIRKKYTTGPIASGVVTSSTAAVMFAASIAVVAATDKVGNLSSKNSVAKPKGSIR